MYYEIVAPERGALLLHPSRVLRFLGNELPDPTLGVPAWSDSILQTLYDAIHAMALTTTGATSLMHEAKPFGCCRTAGRKPTITFDRFVCRSMPNRT